MSTLLPRGRLLKKTGLDAKVLGNSTINRVPLELVFAMISVESGGDANALEYDSDYHNTHLASSYARRLGTRVYTEEKLQRFRWGLMGIGGATARCCGFSGPLIELLEPNPAVFWGCAYLGNLYQTHGEWADAIAYYRLGNRDKKLYGYNKDKDYVKRVLGAWEYYKS